MTVFVKLSNFQKRFFIFSKMILVSSDIAPCPIRNSPYCDLPLIKKAVTMYHSFKLQSKNNFFIFVPGCLIDTK